MTNEQSVVELETAATALKDVYYDYLRPLSVAYSEEDRPFTVTELLECQRLGAKYFNAVENFVASSGLFGAHDKGVWITNFAETCHSVLGAYMNHIRILRVHAKYLTQVHVEPDPMSMASMQRMVKEYCTKKRSRDLFKAFKKAKLPTEGFTVAAHQDREKLPAWQLITCMVIGIFLLLGMGAIALFVPTPTEFQGWVFRGIFALSLTCVIAGVPGFMKMKLRFSSLGQMMSVVAGGSLVMFFLIWLINPPKGYSGPGIQAALESSIQNNAQGNTPSNTQNTAQSNAQPTLQSKSEEATSH